MAIRNPVDELAGVATVKATVAVEVDGVPIGDVTVSVRGPDPDMIAEEVAEQVRLLVREARVR